MRSSLIFLIAFPLLLSAQQPTTWAAPGFQHQHWTAANGLPMTQVTAWQRTDDGFVWLSTFDGLARFDGLQFDVVQGRGFDDLPSSRFKLLAHTDSGRIWLTADPGDLIEFRNGVFINHQRHEPGLFANLMVVDTVAGEQKIFFTSSRGILEFVNGRFELVHEVPLNAEVFAFKRTRDGSFWIGTETGQLIEVVAGDPEPVRTHDWPVGDAIFEINASDPGDVWVAGDRHVARIQRGRRTEYPRFPASVHTYRIHPPEDGFPLWVEAYAQAWVLIDGAWVAPAADSVGRVTPWVGRLAEDGSRWLRTQWWVAVDGEVVMRSYQLRELGEDPSGGVWVWGGSGLHWLDRAFVEQKGVDLGWPANVYSLHPSSDGGFWTTFLASNGRGSLARVRGADVDTVSWAPQPGIEMAVLEDRQGRVWAAQNEQTGGVCLVVEDRCVEANGFDGRTVRGIFESADGTLWFGTRSGVYRYLPNGQWSYLGPDEGLRNPHVRVFAEDSRGRIWMGTFGAGIAVWDRGTLRWIDETDGLSQNSVRSLYIDERDVVWASTERAGVNRIDPRYLDDPAAAGAIATIDSSAGLFADGVHAILPGAHDRLWMSTNQGVFRVDRAEMDAVASGRQTTVRSTPYQEDSGLINRELNGGVQGAGMVGSDGTLMFAGMYGIVWIDQEGIESEQNQAPPVVRFVRARDSVWTTSGGEVRLPRGARDFEVDFTAPVYRNPLGARFRYRLEGLDPDWVEVGSRRSAFYTNVPPGRHVFEVAVRTEGAAAWVAVRQPIEVVVPHRWHEHPVSRASGGLLLLLIVTLGTRRSARRERDQRRKLESLVADRTATIRSQAERLRQLDEAKNLLFEDLSHELRTPLTLILGNLERLRKVSNADDPPRLNIALQQTRRLQTLVDQILDLTKLEPGNSQLHLETLDLAELSRHVTRAFAPVAERAQVTLQIRVLTGPMFARVDREQMTKVLSNLISNAIKFSDAGSAVTVVVDERSDPAATRAVVQVQDRGPGIPDNEVDQIFERFYRGSDARAQQVPGTGLGLPLSKRLIEAFDGQIEVQSREGFGSLFSIVLPTTDPPPADAAASEGIKGALEPDLPFTEVAYGETTPRKDQAPETGALEPRAPADSSTLALVVDDHRDVRALMRDLLEPRYRVVEASHGREALARMDEQTPDIILCDVKMPGMSAQQLIDTIRADEVTATIPIILISARATREDRQAGFEWGADGYVTKPFEPEVLLSQIEATLRSRARTIEAARPVIHLHPSDVEPRNSDEEFLSSVRDVIEDRMQDPAFDVNELARALGYSRSAFYRHLDELGVGSPAELIRQMRLERSLQLIEAGEASVSRIAWRVGFKSTSHFSKLFRDRFGAAPSEFVQRRRPPRG